MWPFQLYNNKSNNTKNLVSFGIFRCRLFTPDASESYGAQWTRDFAYMLMEASDLIDMSLVKAAIEITIGGVRADGKLCSY